MRETAVVFGIYFHGERAAEYYVESDAFVFQLEAQNESHALAVAKAAFPFLCVIAGEGQHFPSRPSIGKIKIVVER